MRTLLIALTLAVLAPVALAQEQDAKEHGERPAPAELEKQFTRARIAEKEGKFEAAIEEYERVIRGWPDDQIRVQRAYAHIVRCQIRLGRFDVAERTVRHAPGNIPGLDEKWVEQAMKEIGEARARHRRELEVRRHAELQEHTIREMTRIWKEQGVAPDEIERRIARVKRDHEAARERMKGLEEAKRAIEEAGVEKEELQRRLEELKRERHALDEHEWRRLHDRGMDEARKEFLRLAERLGIPPEKAERFLEEHRPGRRPEAHFETQRPDAENARRAIEEAHEALEQQRRAIREAHEGMEESRRAVGHMEHRLEEMERHMEGLTRRLEDGGERVRHIEEKGGDRLERLEALVEKLTEKLVPHLEKMEARIGKLESAVKKLLEK